MQGFTKQINGIFADIAPDVTTIKHYTPLRLEMLGKRSHLTYSDFQVLKSKIKQAETMTAEMYSRSFSGNAQYGSYSYATRITGTESSFQDAFQVYPEHGRFLRPEDDNKNRRVAFIGSTIIDELHLPKNPVGEFIQLGNEWFRIIGVGEKQGSIFGLDQDDYIRIPISTMNALAGENKHYSNVRIMYRLKPGVNDQEIQNLITRILRQQHKISSGQDNDFQFESSEKSKASLKKFTDSATGITAGIVGISLIVGGIGVMNIMLVSVTERTRVIGTLKALGATPGFIMLQFLVEAVVLSLFGGAIGLIIGYGLSAFISVTIPGMPDAYIPAWAVLLSFGFTSAIGIVFGLAPAIKAARLNPIDALRYE